GTRAPERPRRAARSPATPRIRSRTASSRRRETPAPPRSVLRRRGELLVADLLLDPLLEPLPQALLHLVDGLGRRAAGLGHLRDGLPGDEPLEDRQAGGLALRPHGPQGEPEVVLHPLALPDLVTRLVPVRVQRVQHGSI